MSAQYLLDERHVVSENSFAELVVWQLPSPVPGSSHLYKYRLAFVVEGICMLRFDNETGKGDHMHLGTKEQPYLFTTPAQLIEHFWNAVDRWED
jgi:hypothetical protein